MRNQQKSEFVMNLVNVVSQLIDCMAKFGDIKKQYDAYAAAGIKINPSDIINGNEGLTPEEIDKAITSMQELSDCIYGKDGKSGALNALIALKK
jgi:hypothetical protein